MCIKLLESNPRKERKTNMPKQNVRRKEPPTGKVLSAIVIKAVENEVVVALLAPQESHSFTLNRGYEGEGLQEATEKFEFQPVVERLIFDTPLNIKLRKKGKTFEIVFLEVAL